MIRTLVLVMLATFAFAAEDKPEPKSPATLLYEKALADNSKDVEKTYAVYLKALEVANAKVLKALEVAKSDLNDPKKGKLSITERAKALEELDGKIKGLKGGELATVVAEKEKEKEKDAGDLLGDKVVASKDPIIGKWQRVDANGKEWNEKYNCTYEFNKDGSGLCNGSKKVLWKLTEPNVYHISCAPGQSADFMAAPEVDITIIDDGKEMIESYGGPNLNGTRYRRANDKSIKPNKERK